MAYFINFPNIIYNFEVNGKTTLIAVKDIALNVRVRKEILENITLYDEYDIEDNETFEIISEKLYGRPDYHWTIMLLNQRFDYRTDFPMNSEQLLAYCEEKYGANNVYNQNIIFGQPNYQDRNGNTVTKLPLDQFRALYPYTSYQDFLNKNPTSTFTEIDYRLAYKYDDYDQYSDRFIVVTNYDYEYSINESKRRIKVLNPTAVSKAVSDIQRLIGS